MAIHPLHLPSMTESVEHGVALQDGVLYGPKIVESASGGSLGVGPLKEIVFGSVGLSFLFTHAICL